MKSLLILPALFVLLSCDSDQTDVPPASVKAETFDHPYIDNKARRAQAEAPEIHVIVQGFPGGNLAKLVGIFEDQNYLADSAMIQPNGEMVFKNKEPYMPGMLFLSMPNNMMFQILVDLDQTFTLRTTVDQPVMNMRVEGSLDNELLYSALKYEEIQRPKFQANAELMQIQGPKGLDYPKLKADLDQLLDHRIAFFDSVFQKNPASIFTSFKRAGQNPDVRDAMYPDGSMDTARYNYLYRQRFWNGVDFKDERLLYTPVISNKLKRYINDITPQHPDSVVQSSLYLVDKVVGKNEFFKYFANWIVLHYDPKESTLMDPQAVYVNMVERYFTQERAFWADSATVFGLQQRAYEMSASLAGKKAPDVQAADPSGQLRSIYEMQSPYIVVYMWNPDCEHCAEQTPQLVKLWHQMHDKGLDVYGIAVNTEDAKWKEAIKKYGMPWVSVFDPTNKSIFGKYYVDNTPEVYLLNPERKIIAKNLHVDQVIEMVERDKKGRK